jgi:hypothetical protein
MAQKVELNSRALTGILEKPVLVTKYGHSFALLVPERVIPVHQRDDVIQVKVARASEPVKEFTLYTRHLPGYKRAYLDVFQLKPKAEEKFWIMSARIYSAEEFVSGYNAGKPLGLDNTELVWGAHGFGMKVDNIEVQLNEANFRTYQGMVILNCEIGTAGAIKIQKKVDGFEVRLKDHSPVTSITLVAAGVMLTYSRTNHDSYPHSRMAADSMDGMPQRVILEEPVIGILNVRKPSRFVEPYEIVVDQATLDRVVDQLAAKNLDEYREMKGAIGAALVRRLLPEFGMDFVQDHPQSPMWWTARSKIPGPDILARTRASGELVYLESKWWDKVKDALRKAPSQVLADLKKHPTWHGEIVTAGYAAVVEWEADSTTLHIYLQKG